MEDLKIITRRAIRNSLMTALLNFVMSMVALWAAYTNTGYEVVAYSACSAFLFKQVFYNLRWASFMKNQYLWMKEFKTVYPLPAPDDSKSLKKLIMDLCPW